MMQVPVGILSRWSIRHYGKDAVFRVAPLPILFERDCKALSLFTTISTLGTPEDISLDEFRGENLFLMDPATKIIFQTWAKAY